MASQTASRRSSAAATPPLSAWAEAHRPAWEHRQGAPDAGPRKQHVKEGEMWLKVRLSLYQKARLDDWSAATGVPISRIMRTLLDEAIADGRAAGGADRLYADAPHDGRSATEVAPSPAVPVPTAAPTGTGTAPSRQPRSRYAAPDELWINVRVSWPQKERLNAWSARAHLSISVILRLLLAAALEQGRDHLPPPSPLAPAPARP